MSGPTERRFCHINAKDCPIGTPTPEGYLRLGQTIVSGFDLRQALFSAKAPNKKAHPQQVSLVEPDHWLSLIAG